MRPLKAKISITLDEDVLEKVKKLAEQNERSVSQYINLVLKETCNKATEQNPK